MKILSLFDGISCGMVALERCNIPVEQYDAYEIDEDAIKISKHNYPMINHKGDVFNAEYKEGVYDLLIGGSPCTYWSIAAVGKNGHREVTSSGLGWELFKQYVRALNEVKPKYFLYENNASMSSDIKNEISKNLGVEPVMIDSADFSAQRRKRYYWTNINFSKNWKKSPILFKDIEDTESEKKTRSIAKYKNTYKWSRDGKTLSWDTSGKGWYSQANRAKTTDQKFNTVCACRPSSKSNVWLGNDTIRLITYKELERLQTLPDDYTAVLSNKQEARGKCIGNGWTVNVVAHILCATTSEPIDKTYHNCEQQSFNFEELL